MADHVVIARFDEKTDKKLKAFGKELTDKGYSVPEWPPHITIAAYEGLEEAPICEYTEAFAKSHNKIGITLVSLGVLPPRRENPDTAVVCLAPAHSEALVRFYYEFHKKYEEYCTGIGRFNSISGKDPIIHATVGIFDKNRLQEILDILFDSDIYGTAELSALEVYSYPMKLIRRYELK